MIAIAISYYSWDKAAKPLLFHCHEKLSAHITLYHVVAC